MSRQNRDKGRLPAFVPLLIDTMTTEAWRTMSPSARVVYIALKQRYSSNFKNNGKIYLSTRRAAKEVKLNKETTARCFHELQHYGFIVMTIAGCLGVEGKGKAPHWRLTELGYMGDPPTRDFAKWNGEIFSPAKKRKPVRKIQTECPENPDMSAYGKSGHSPSSLYEKSRHTVGPTRTENPDITSLTTPQAEKAAGQPPQRGAAAVDRRPRHDDDLSIPEFLRRTTAT